MSEQHETEAEPMGGWPAVRITGQVTDETTIVADEREAESE